MCVFLASAARADSLDDILKRWDLAAKDFTAFTADLKQTQYTKVVNKSEVMSAVVRLKRTDKGVFGIVRYTGEDPHTIHFAGSQVEIYYPKANQLDIYDAKKYSDLIRDVLMLGFGTSGSDVKKTYVVKDGGPEMAGSRRTTRIDLVPKNKQFQDYAEKIEVWVPEGESNPIQVKATQPSGNYNIYVYSKVMLLKPPLKDSDFDFDPDQKPNPSTYIKKN
jgi:outer membrane lipoprotein-sorting protein